MRKVSVKRDGTIHVDGKVVGYVMPMPDAFRFMGRFRAEIGSPDRPKSYKVVYAQKKWDAVDGVLEAAGMAT